MSKVLFIFLSFFIILNVAEARVYTGLEVFLSKYKYLVKGKRVGLVTNQTGVNAKLESTIDLFYKDKDINLVALFAPEHGVRGEVYAGKSVSRVKDQITGLPVYSLYAGGDHKPSKAALSKIDVLVYDIQDVGNRAYTFIWHLAKCMEAAKENNISVIVLDRPNPYGANVVDGPMMEDKFRSFIGLYNIPRVYGMTVGELALYLNTEEKIRCKLGVIPMYGYRRGMYWEMTGLPWVPTSPNIPTPQAAYSYSATGTLGETSQFNIGIGYTLPFQCVAAPWISAVTTSKYLNKLGLPGVVFRPIYYTPFYGKYKGQVVSGFQIHVINPATFRPALTELSILVHFQRYYKGNFKWEDNRKMRFDKAMGNETTRLWIQGGQSINKIYSKWRDDITIFKLKRKRYLLYK